MIGAQLDSTRTGAGGSESMAGEGSGSLSTRLSCKVRSMFGSIAAEGKASVVGSIHLSSDGTICSGMKAGAAAGTIPWILPDGRSKSCLSGLSGAPDTWSNLSKIKSPRISAV